MLIVCFICSLEERNCLSEFALAPKEAAVVQQSIGHARVYGEQIEHFNRFCFSKCSEDR